MPKKNKKRASKAARRKRHRSRSPRKAAAPTKKATGSRTGTMTSAVAREEERKRLLKEERDLERDMENDSEQSTLGDSAEFIPGALDDDLAEEMGEASVESATSGVQADEDIRDEDVPEDEGGPFVPSSGRKEFAHGTDASNPKDAEPADFPTPNRRRR